MPLGDKTMRELQSVQQHYVAKKFLFCLFNSSENRAHV